MPLIDRLQRLVSPTFARLKHSGRPMVLAAHTSGQASPLPPRPTPSAPDAKAAFAPLIAFEDFGRPVWAPRDYAAFAREGVMQNAVVYRSVRMISECVATIPLIAYDRSREVEHHPLLDLLARPAPGMTGTDLMEQFIGFLLVSGNGYLEAVADGDTLIGLAALRPDRMKVIPGADGWPEGYEYAAGSHKHRLAGEAVPGVARVLHLKLFHPANDHYGLSPIEAAATAIDIHNTAARWNKALLDNAARPSGALVYTRGGHLTSDQFTRLKAELETSFQGARNAGRPLLLEGGLDWKAMSLSPRDMDFIELKHAAAREIALAIGVPPQLLGIPGDSTYANYQEANRAFWRQTVVPLAHRIARALTSWLGALDPATPLTFKPNLDDIEALSSEREALWTRLEAASFLTRDEKRAAAGYEAAELDAESEAKFDPNQPRDDHGRWTDDDGGGGSSDSQFRLPAGLPVHLAQGRGGRGRFGRQQPPPKPDPNPLVPPGTTIRNRGLAGQKHSDTKIPFDKDGFPDFSSVATHTVKVPHTGTKADINAANRAAGFKDTPPGMTWHHHQDGHRMQLVPSDIHSKTGHTGSRGIGNLPGRK